MGLAKRKLEEIQEKQFVGLFILIKASVLEPCEFHEDVFLSGDADIEDAYRLGNAKWSKGELREVFLNRRFI
ncbi:MAG: hypothetical protein NTY36_06700 [Deltaproteobacteria bacterium]|nr:hypothetical protein [Deltaproteobacteria bacterium]